MEIYKITADVICGGFPKSKLAYRLYLDDDLLIERTIYWHINSQFMRETIVAQLEQGKHTLRVQLHPSNKFCFLKNICISNPNKTISYLPAKIAYEFEI